MAFFCSVLWHVFDKIPETRESALATSGELSLFTCTMVSGGLNLKGNTPQDSSCFVLSVNAVSEAFMPSGKKIQFLVRGLFFPTFSMKEVSFQNIWIHCMNAHLCTVLLFPPAALHEFVISFLWLYNGYCCLFCLSCEWKGPDLPSSSSSSFCLSSFYPPPPLLPSLLFLD